MNNFLYCTDTCFRRERQKNGGDAARHWRQQRRQRTTPRHWRQQRRDSKRHWRTQRTSQTRTTNDSKSIIIMVSEWEAKQESSAAWDDARPSILSSMAMHLGRRLRKWWVPIVSILPKGIPARSFKTLWKNNTLVGKNRVWICSCGRIPPVAP